MAPLLAGLFVVLLATRPASVVAQESDWPFHGFAQVNWSARTTNADSESLLSDNFLWGDERLQLELERFSGGGTASFLVKIDFFHDAVEKRADLEVREASVDLALDPVRLTLGRQILTWGVGDLIFINDVFPKDYTALFSGRPLQYLKIGVDALKLDVVSRSVSAELVLIPVFQSDRLPGPDRFILPDLFGGLEPIERQPDRSLSNAELAVRVYRRLLGADVSLYAYRGFHGAPAAQPDGESEPGRISLRFPRLNVYGASLQRAGFGGVVSTELGYHDSREDRDGSDPSIPNSEVRALLAYQRQLWPESRLGLQYYAEWMQDYSAHIASLDLASAARDEVRHVATLRYTQQLAYQTWQLSLFLFLGLSEADYYVIPEVRNRVTEDLWLALGANLFGGGVQDLFGALDENDNLYLTARFGF